MEGVFVTKMGMAKKKSCADDGMKKRRSEKTNGDIGTLGKRGESRGH